MTGLTSRPDDMGVRFHAKDGKRRRPTRTIPWLGFVVHANGGEGKMEGGEVLEARGLCQDAFGPPLGYAMSARAFFLRALF